MHRHTAGKHTLQVLSHHRRCAAGETGPLDYSSVSLHRVSMHANAGCEGMDDSASASATPGAHAVIRGEEAMAFVQMTVRPSDHLRLIDVSEVVAGTT